MCLLELVDKPQNAKIFISLPSGRGMTEPGTAMIHNEIFRSFTHLSERYLYF